MNNLDNILSLIGNESLLLKMSISTFETELRNTLKLLENKDLLFKEEVAFVFYLQPQLNLLFKITVQDPWLKSYKRGLNNYCQALQNSDIDYSKLHNFLVNLLDYCSNNTNKEFIIKKLL